MKNFSKVLGLATCAVALGALVSCTEVNEPYYIPGTPTGNSGSILVKDPKVVAWSGKETFSLNGTTTRADDVEAATPVTQDEIAAAKAYFCDKDDWKPGDGGTEIETLAELGWSNYYVQYVVEGNKIPLEIAQFVGTNNETVSNIAVWDMDPDEVLKIIDTDNYLVNEAKVEIVEDGQLVERHKLQDISFETAGYDINNTYYEKVRTSGKAHQYGLSPDYRIAKLDGYDDAVYVALYGYTNQNNGYWDRIIKISKVDLPELEEETPEEGPVVKPEGPIVHDNEVEVNLSLLDMHDNYSVEDLMTKLSIHVRYAKDVKVRIPVPYETLVPKDDLDIILARPELVYGKENHAEFLVGGNLVELNVAFEECLDCAGNGYGYYIEVSTKGINKDVMAYCFKNNGDGINFEVYNYYQFNTQGEDGEMIRRKPTTEELEELKTDWLNKTTIEFGYDNGTWNAYTNISDYPYYFINAFNSDKYREEPQGVVNEMDCFVHVISNQGDSYADPFEAEHLNASGFNWIYVREDIFGTDKQDDAHTDRNPAPAPPVPVY